MYGTDFAVTIMCNDSFLPFRLSLQNNAGFLGETYKILYSLTDICVFSPYIFNLFIKLVDGFNNSVSVFLAVFLMYAFFPVNAVFPPVEECHD